MDAFSDSPTPIKCVSILAKHNRQEKGFGYLETHLEQAKVFTNQPK